MNIDLLTYALQNEENLNIAKTNNQSIKTNKNDILQKFNLSKDELKLLHLQLKDYIYVDDINDIKYGHYIRWINLNKSNGLTRGNFICNIDYDKNKNFILKLKTYANKYITIYFENCLIFKKLTHEELIILKAIRYLEK
jgi:hypothetical protein